MHAALELVRLCLSYFTRETRLNCAQLAALPPPILPLHAAGRILALCSPVTMGMEGLQEV